MPRSLGTAHSQNTGMAKNRNAKKVEMLSNIPYWRIALVTPMATPRITDTNVAATTRRRVTGEVVYGDPDPRFGELVLHQLPELLPVASALRRYSTTSGSSLMISGRDSQK